MSLTRTTWAGINTVLKFLETELNTHQVWIDGKQIYRKVVNVGFYPNATIKQMAHNIRFIDNVIRIYGMGKNDTYKQVFPNTTCDLYVNGAFLLVDASSNFSTYEGYVIVEYTKNDP